MPKRVIKNKKEMNKCNRLSESLKKKIWDKGETIVESCIEGLDQIYYIGYGNQFVYKMLEIMKNESKGSEFDRFSKALNYMSLLCYSPYNGLTSLERKEWEKYFKKKKFYSEMENKLWLIDCIPTSLKQTQDPVLLDIDPAILKQISALYGEEDTEPDSEELAEELFDLCKKCETPLEPFLDREEILKRCPLCEVIIAGESRLSSTFTPHAFTPSRPGSELHSYIEDTTSPLGENLKQTQLYSISDSREQRYNKGREIIDEILSQFSMVANSKVVENNILQLWDYILQYYSDLGESLGKTQEYIFIYLAVDCVLNKYTDIEAPKIKTTIFRIIRPYLLEMNKEAEFRRRIPETLKIFNKILTPHFGGEAPICNKPWCNITFNPFWESKLEKTREVLTSPRGPWTGRLNNSQKAAIIDYVTQIIYYHNPSSLSNRFKLRYSPPINREAIKELCSVGNYKILLNKIKEFFNRNPLIFQNIFI